MKTKLLCLAIMAIVATGCGGNDDETPQDPAASCGNVSNFSVIQENDRINFELTATAQPLYYETAVVYAQNDSPENGNTFVLNETSESFTAQELGVIEGYTYKIYIRSVCDNGAKSAWSAPKILQFDDYCGMPKNLGVSLFPEGMGFVWESSDNANSYYELSYGPQGFAIGNGTTVSLNGLYYVAPLSANTTYDFYVRSYCSAATGWSSWAGPYTYFSQYNQNLCTQPSNVTYTLESSNAVNINWNRNGESRFECALLSGSQNINNASLYTIDNSGSPTFTGLSTSVTYTFYVRAVCSNGNRTPWTTKLVDL